MAAEEGKVVVTSVDAAQGAAVNLTMAEGKAATNDTGPSAEKIGVSDEQFAKFYDKSADSYNWQAHAKESEYKLAQKATADVKGGTQDAGTVAAGPNTDTVVAAAGLDFAVLGQTIIDTGDISADDYAALSKIGIPEDVAKSYVEQQLSNATAHVSKVLEAFGGEAGFEQARVWAKANLTEAEIVTLETGLADKDGYGPHVDALIAKAGMPPVVKGELTNAPNAGGGNVSPTGVTPYPNEAAMIADQRDPKYKKDPAFRENVMARLKVSNWENNPRAHSGGL